MSTKEFLITILFLAVLIGGGIFAQYYDPLEFYRKAKIDVNVTISQNQWVKKNIRRIGKIIIVLSIIMFLLVTREYFSSL